MSRTVRHVSAVTVALGVVSVLAVAPAIASPATASTPATATAEHSATAAGARASGADLPTLRVHNAAWLKHSKRVIVGVSWKQSLAARAGSRHRFTVRLTARRSSTGSASLRMTALLSPREIAHGDTFLVIPLKRKQERILKQAARITVTATQQYDRPGDADKFFETTYVDSDLIKGKRHGRSCRGTRIGPGADLRGCDLSGARLRNVDLSNARLGSAAGATGAHRAATLADADLSGARLRGAGLHRVSLVGTQLGSATWTDGRRCDDRASVGRCVPVSGRTLLGEKVSTNRAIGRSTPSGYANNEAVYFQVLVGDSGSSQEPATNPDSSWSFHSVVPQQELTGYVAKYKLNDDAINGGGNYIYSMPASSLVDNFSDTHLNLAKNGVNLHYPVGQLVN